MIKKRYKVITIYMGVMQSAVVASRSFSIEYRVDEWAKAVPMMAEGGYYPLVFGTLGHARRFIECDVLKYKVIYEIWLCDVKEKVKLPPMLRFDSIESGIFDVRSIQTWPLGTEMFKYIKLTTRLSHRSYR